VVVATVGNPRSRKPLGQIVRAPWRGAVVRFTKLSAGIRLTGARMLDLAGTESPSLRDLAAVSVGCGRPCAGGHTGRVLGTTGNVQDVQLAAGGRLGGVVLGRIMRNIIAINDVVVPVS
jgi:hypothetical protein